MIGKGGEDRQENTRRAEECFQRALELNPEIPLAHNLYALLEIDQGRAQDAMVRLVERGRSGSVQPELYAALVQACRFCGLLEASAAAHERARQLDRNALTSVEHTYSQLGDDERLLEHIQRRYYGVTSPTHRTMLALRFGEQGRKDEAVRLLREIEQENLTEMFPTNVSSFRALFEGRREESLEGAQRLIDMFPDPEAVYYAARILAYFGERERAFDVLNRCLDQGYVLYRAITREDPWLDSLRASPELDRLVRRAKSRYLEAVAAFRDAGGEQLLGVNLEPPGHPGDV